jgi:hypothetical protein
MHSLVASLVAIDSIDHLSCELLVDVLVPGDREMNRSEEKVVMLASVADEDQFPASTTPETFQIP